MINLTKLFILTVILIISGYSAYPQATVKEVVNHDELINEIDIKLQRVKSFMTLHGLSAMLLTKTNNFSWMTAGIGDNHIVLSSEAGFASILIMNTGKKYILATETEIPHILQEEVNGLGYEPIGWGWWENRDLAEVAKKLVGDGIIGCDIPMNGLEYVEKEFNALRFELTDSEIKKYRWVCKESAEAVETICKKVKPGMSDRQIEAMMSDELMRRGLRPTVILVGVDERLQKFYHCPPIGAILKKHVFVNICAKRWGMVSSVGRYVYFGTLPDSIRKNLIASANISARFIHASKPGTKASDLFLKGKAWYKEQGFPEAWQKIHQGGGIGYAEREWLASETATEVLQDRQALAWNPFTPAALSFDTILLLDGNVEILTSTKGLPSLDVTIDNKTYSMPFILVKNTN